MSVAISPDGNTLVTGSADKNIKVWNLKTGQVIRTLNGHSSWITAVAIAPVQQFVSEQPLDSLKIRIWHGTGEWTLYEDDGHSFEHEQGVWATTNYQVYFEGERAIVEIAAREGEFAICDREVTVEVVGIGEQQFTDDGTVRRLIF
ncbi:MAG: DUF5110 domain-containing protein [Microcoleus sp.]